MGIVDRQFYILPSAFEILFCYLFFCVPVVKVVGQVLPAGPVLSRRQDVDPCRGRRFGGVGRLRVGRPADGTGASARGTHGLLPPGELLSLLIVFAVVVVVAENGGVGVVDDGVGVVVIVHDDDDGVDDGVVVVAIAVVGSVLLLLVM